MAWHVMEINRRFLVNKHGDLYFLLHNFGALIILFILTNLQEICLHRKKMQLKVCTKSILNQENYDSENIDSRNVLVTVVSKRLIVT